MSYDGRCYCQNRESCEQNGWCCFKCYEEYSLLFQGIAIFDLDKSPNFPKKEDTYWEIYQRNLHAERQFKELVKKRQII